MAEKIQFKSFLSKCDKNDSNVGTEWYFKHIRKLDHDKSPSLVRTERINKQDIINSFADSCDINNLIRTMSIETYQKLVDDMHNAVQFIDATKIPTNIFEMQNFKYEMIDKFNSLPIDLKELYDNNYNKFIESIENGKVNGIVESYFDSLYKRNSSNVSNDNIVKEGDK